MQIVQGASAQGASAQIASANRSKKWHNARVNPHPRLNPHPALNPPPAMKSHQAVKPHLPQHRQAVQPQGQPQTSRRQAVKPARLQTLRQAKVTRADRAVPTMTPERSDAASAKQHCKPKAFYQNSSAETDGVWLNLELDTKASEYILPDGIGEFQDLLAIESFGIDQDQWLVLPDPQRTCLLGFPTTTINQLSG